MDLRRIEGKGETEAMKYEHMTEGIFLSRPNRFIAMVEAEGSQAKAHVKNTGRCRELLIPGTKVFLQKHSNPERKTKYSLIGVIKGDVMVNMDSQAPNHVVREWLEQGGIYQNPDLIAAERKYGGSRFDFYIEGDGKKAFVEVKGYSGGRRDCPVSGRADRTRRQTCKRIDEMYRRRL